MHVSSSFRAFTCKTRCAGDVPLKATRGMRSRTPGDVISGHFRLKTRGACFKRPQYGQTWLACYWTGDSPGPACTTVVQVSGVFSGDNGHLNNKLCKSPSATDPVTDFRAPRWCFFSRSPRTARIRLACGWYLRSVAALLRIILLLQLHVRGSRLEVMQSDVDRLEPET